MNAPGLPDISVKVYHPVKEPGKLLAKADKGAR
jgi:hypothetical protein